MNDVKHVWGDRPVVFKDFTVKDLQTVRAAFQEKAEKGMWLVLSLSAHYGDGEGERVFADVDAIEAQPARMTIKLTALAAAAMAANGMEDSKEGNDAAPLA